MYHDFFTNANREFVAKFLNSLKRLPRIPDCLKTTDYTIQFRTSRTENDSI